MARQTSTPLMPGIIRSVITQVGRPLVEEAKRLLGVVGGAHVKALRGEGGAQHAGNLRFVVDDQNSAGHGSLLSREDYIIRAGRYDACDERLRKGSPTARKDCSLARGDAGCRG